MSRFHQLVAPCVAALCLVVVPTPASAATPTLEGVYSVGALGFVEFTRDQGMIIGRYRGGGACAFEPNLIVVSNGVFEDDLFLGQVLVCQEERTGCARRKSFPFMGFHRETPVGTDEVLGWVKLESGCSSKATDDRRLLFRRATEAEKGALVPRVSKSELDEKLKEAIAAASDKFEQGSFTAARDGFRLALTYDSNNLPALVGVGAAQVKLGEYRGAVESLLEASRRARDSQSNGVLGMAQYNLACAYARQGLSRESLAALGEALRLVGPGIADDVLTDRDLEPIRGTAEYRKLTSKLRRKPR